MKFSELGERIKKQISTQDKYFCFISRKPIKKRRTRGDLTPLIYGHCLLRTVHYIHALRRENPQQKIVIGKYDINLDYRRGTVWVHLEAMCMNAVKGISILSFRLTFGVYFCPFTRFFITDIFPDLENELLRRKKWDLEDLNSSHRL